MKRTLLIGYLAAMSSLVQGQNVCDEWFYKFDPSYTTLPTQQLIINQILECHFGLGAPDTLSLYDRYVSGFYNDRSNAIESIFFDILQSYTEASPEAELGFNLEGLSKSTFRAPQFSFDISQDVISTEGRDDSFLDGQIERLFGDATDSYFINEIEYLPLEVTDAIEDFVARKVSYIRARDGINIYEEAANETDPEEYLYNVLDIALIDPVYNLSRLFNRHLNYYAFIQEEIILEKAAVFDGPSQAAITAVDTAFVRAIDIAGKEASELYEDYRANEMLEIARAYDTLTTNMELNLEALQCIQDNLTNEIGSLSQSQNNFINDGVGNVEAHGGEIDAVIRSNDLMTAYLNGDLDLSRISDAYGIFPCGSGTIASTVADIESRIDMTGIGKAMRYLDTYQEDIEGGRGSALFATGVVGIAAAYKVTQFSMSAYKWNKNRSYQKVKANVGKPKRTLRQSAAAKMRGLKSSVKKLSWKKAVGKVWPKGAKALAKGGIQGYLIELAAKEILNEAVTAPILGAIDNLRQEMNGRFNRIEMRIDDVLDLQVRSTTAILDGLQTNTEIMQRNFNSIDFTLQEILNNQNQIQSSISNALVTLSGFNQCQSALDIVQNQLGDSLYQSYDQLISTYNGILPLPDCLDGLRSVLTDNSSCANISFFTADPTGSDYALLEIENFQLAAQLFNYIYGPNYLDRRHQATQMLSIETDHTLDNQWDLSKVLSYDYDLDLDPDVVLDQGSYIDVSSLTKIIDFFEAFAPFYEVFESTTNRAPLPLEEYVSLDTEDDKEVRLGFMMSSASSLLCVTRMARAQQALVSGSLLLEPIYQIMYQGVLADATIPVNGQQISLKRFVIHLLRKNAVLSANFMTYVAQKNYAHPRPADYNYVTNGSFSFGLANFESDQNYQVTDDPNEAFSFMADMEDHTPNDDNMMFVSDHNVDFTNAWRQTITLDSGSYEFSAFVGENTPTERSFQNWPRIQLSINDSLFSKEVLLREILSWNYVTLSFELEETATLEFKIDNLRPTVGDNNLMIDDVAVRKNNNLIPNGYFELGNTLFESDLAFKDNINPKNGDNLYLVGRTSTGINSILPDSRGVEAVQGDSFFGRVSPDFGPQMIWAQSVQLRDGGVYDLSFNVADNRSASHNPSIVPKTSLLIEDLIEGDTTMILEINLENKRWYSPTVRLYSRDYSDSIRVMLICDAGSEEARPILDGIALRDLSIPSDTVSPWLEGPITSPDTVLLEREARVDDLDWTSFSHPDLSERNVFLKLEATGSDCPADGLPINCVALLQRPRLSTMATDRFSYTEAFARLKAQMSRSTNIHVNHHMADQYPTQPIDLHLAKAVLLNPSNQ